MFSRIYIAAEILSVTVNEIYIATETYLNLFAKVYNLNSNFRTMFVLILYYICLCFSRITEYFSNYRCGLITSMMYNNQ